MDKHNRILTEKLNLSEIRVENQRMQLTTERDLRVSLVEALEQCQDELNRERELHTRALEQADGLMVNSQILCKQLRERQKK